jgi:hypothetical protein
MTPALYAGLIRALLMLLATSFPVGSHLIFRIIFSATSSAVMNPLGHMAVIKARATGSQSFLILNVHGNTPAVNNTNKPLLITLR